MLSLMFNQGDAEKLVLNVDAVPLIVTTTEPEETPEGTIAEKELDVEAVILVIATLLIVTANEEEVVGRFEPEKFKVVPGPPNVGEKEETEGVELVEALDVVPELVVVVVVVVVVVPELDKAAKVFPLDSRLNKNAVSALLSSLLCEGIAVQFTPKRIKRKKET